MTIEQKTIELQSVSPPLTRDQIIAELGKWQAEQSMQETEGVLAEKETPEVVEKQEPVEEKVEEKEEVIEEEGNQEVVADQQDAAVTTTPDNASEEEDTESQSEDGSSESQEPEEEEEEESYEVVRQRFFDTVEGIKNRTARISKIQNYLQTEFKDVNSEVNIPNIGEEIQGKGGFTYKYTADVDDEGNLDLQVFYKGKDDEEFINATERARNNPNSVTLNNQEASIQSALGFLSEDVADNIYKQRKAREAALKQQQQQPQDFDPNREGIQSFDDMLLYNYQEQKIIDGMTTADREVYFSEKNLQASKSNFNEILKSNPELKKWLEEKKSQLGEYNIEKAKIQQKIDALPMGETGKLAEYKKQLEDLEEKFKTVNLIKGESMRLALDEELNAMMPNIITKANEATVIQPVEEPSMFNIVGKVWRGAGQRAFSRGQAAISTVVGDILDPVDKDLLQQQEFYNQAKLEYAKKNKVDINTVTDADVEDIVKNKYIQLFTQQETDKLYRNYSESLIEDLPLAMQPFARAFGFKNIADLFGDTTQEKKEKLITAAIDLDLKQDILKQNLAIQKVTANNFKSLGLANTTYQTQEEAAEAREQLRLLNLETNANLDIINNIFDTAAAKVNDANKATIFNNYYQKNYGFLTETGGRFATMGLDLFVNGLAEYSERMGINVASLGVIGTAAEGLYNKLTGEDLSRKLTNKFTGGVDSVVNYLNDQMAPPTTLDDIESGMDILRWAGGSLGQQIPIYGAIYLSGGTYAPVVIGAAVAGSKFREMQKEIDMGTADYNWWQMYTMANLSGVSAAATEYVTQGMLSRLKFSYQNIPGFKEGFSDTMKGFLSAGGRWARDMGEEIPSEMLDELINNIGDKYVLGKKDVNLFDNLGETALSTLWTAGVAIRAPLIGQQIIAPFRSRQSFQIIGEGQARIKELNETLENNRDLSVDAVNKIKDEINSIIVNNVKALKTDISRLDDLTDNEKRVLLDNKAKEYEIIRSIRDITNDTSLDQKTKDNLISSKQSQLNEISTNSSKILAPYIIAENKAKNEPIIQEAIDKVEQVTKKVLGESINVIDDMNNLPEGVPKFVDAYVDPKTNQIYINKEWAATVGAVTAAEHELLHKIQKSLFDTNPQKAVELVEDFKNTLSNKELRLVQERIDANYRYEMNDDGSFVLDDQGNKIEKDPATYAEEYFNVFSDLVGKNQIGFTDNLGENLLRFVKKLKESVFGPAGFKNLEYQSGRDAYNFIKDYNKSIKEGKVSERAEALIRKGALTTSDRTTRSITTRGQEFIDLSRDGTLTNENLVDTINSESSNQTDKFAAIEAIVETNWPVISKGLKFNPTGSIPMDAVKTAVTEQMQGIFPGRNKPLLADFNADTAQLNTYLGSLMGQRQGEILERAKQIGGTLQDGTSIDSEVAKQVVDTSTKQTTTKRSRTPKTPTETVKYSNTIIEKAGVKDKGELETKITEATTESFKDVDVDRFGQTKDVPPAVAKIYGDMLGLNPETISDKTRTYQNYDEAGLNAAQRFLLANAASDYARLPKTKDETTTRGRGTFIPKNMKDALYTDGKLTGTLKDYMDLLRSKPTGKLYRDSKYAQLIRGLLNTHIRNRMFETLVPTTPQRLRGGAKFSITQAQRPGLYKVGSEDGLVVMRDSAIKFAKDNKIKVEFEGEELTVDNFNASNPKAVEYLKRNIENEMWKHIPLESLTRGTMIDYSSKGNAIFFDSKQFDKILDNAYSNRKKWLAEGNTLSYDQAELKQSIKVAFGTKSPSLVTGNYAKESAKRKVDANAKGVKIILQGGANAIKADAANYLPLIAIYGTQSSSSSHLVRNMAVDMGLSEEYLKAKRSKDGNTVKEHVYPANEMASFMYLAQLYDDVDAIMPIVKKAYFQLGITEIQDNKLIDTDGTYGEKYNYKSTQTQLFYDGLKEYFKTGDVSKIPNALVRYFNPQVNENSSGDNIQGINSNTLDIMGKTVAETYTRQLPKSDQNSNNIYVQNELTYQVMTGEITQAEAVKRLDAQISSGNAKVKPSITNNNMQPNSLKFSDKAAGNSVLVTDELNTLDKALAEGRKVDKPVKKIRVFDFDDTLAKSNSKVIVINPLSSIDSDMLDIVARRKFKKEFENLPSFKQNFNSLNEQQKLEVLKEVPGGTKEINATQFAEQAARLEEQGATFDFSQFEQVIDGKKGPLFNVAKKIAETRGTEDLFILTARPQSAAGPIKAFMKALGINIPLGNITGLSDGTAGAKGRWIAGKAAEGYNDFYFADDSTANVKAVKDVLDQIDVKSRVQQAKFSKTKTFDTIVNQIIEDSSGIESYKKFSAAKARTIGRDKGRFDWLTLASSAEDFKGLLYRLLGDGKQGEAQFEFLKTNLIDTYNRAEDAIVQAKISAANDFMALKEQFPGLPTTLETETGVGKFTYQHALRTYMWTQQGMSIPGLSKTDARKLNKFITDNAQLQSFADQLISIQKGKPYPKPGKDWLGGNLTTDIIGGINKVNRAEYQQEFRENVEIIFSPENLNKMEAAYGTRWRNALENSLKRMKAGTNRLGYNDQTSAVLDWVNNSVGAVMFLNTRSALLQTISAVNFLNWGDNNIIKAGQAFANQKQYWSDFMTLMNSDFLVQRRNGLKINVSESEIADAVKDSKNKAKAAIAYLLNKGFVFTRYADSFAIASGGATFYRNRLKKYLKEGMSQELAQQKAFNDFKDVAEESQQSSDPSKISMQQASAAGRVILNWANTPMQYVRIQKRDLQDLIAGRGDPKVKIARIAYYGVVQNLIFNALQQALFAIGFGDDDEDDEKKKKAKDKKIARVANGMVDSQLKGLGIAGAAMVAAKNTLMKIYEESKKKTPEFEKAAIEALSFSPAISSKYRKIVGALKSFSWNRKKIKEKGFSLDNPAYLAGAQIVTAFTNIPLDRVVKKINNIRGIMNEQSQMWQKVAMALGYSSYDVGLPYYGGWDKPVEPTEAERKKQEIDVMKRDTNTAEQTQMLLDLGLTKKQIKALRYEDNRVKKIIELQNKNKEK